MFAGPMRVLGVAVFALIFGVPSEASPTMTSVRDPIVRCVGENFEKTRTRLNQLGHLRTVIVTELDKQAPDWLRLRRLIIELRQNDISFREETHRVELMCLDKTSFDDRISYLKNEFRNVGVPPVTPVNPRRVAGPAVRSPREIHPIAYYFTDDDYPAAALATKAQGRVTFRLTISPDGRVNECAVLSSSGTAALDQATCRLLRARARFTPALDANGMTTTGSIEDQIIWKLPTK